MMVATFGAAKTVITGWQGQETAAAIAAAMTRGTGRTAVRAQDAAETRDRELPSDQRGQW